MDFDERQLKRNDNTEDFVDQAGGLHEAKNPPPILPIRFAFSHSNAKISSCSGATCREECALIVNSKNHLLFD